MVLKISKQQAIKAIELCLTNALDFIKDAEVHLQNNRLQHVAVPMEFAMEETGKAKIILEKLEVGTTPIELTWKEIFDHETKLHAIDSLLDVPSETTEWLRTTWNEFPLPFGFIDLDKTVDRFVGIYQTEISENASAGHQNRLKSSFVDFDRQTGEPHLESGFNKAHADTLLKSIRQLINQIETDFKQHIST